MTKILSKLLKIFPNKNNERKYCRCEVVKLKNRWLSEDNRINAINKAIIDNQDWTKYLVNHSSHKFGPLALINDSRVKTLPGEVGPRDLRGISLKDIDFSSCLKLSETSFDFSSLENVSFSLANLCGCSFRRITAHNCSFEGAKLDHAIITNSHFDNVSFANSNLCHSLFHNSSFIETCLLGANLKQVRFNTENTFSFIGRLIFQKKGTKFRNLTDNVETKNYQNIDPYFLFYLKDQQRITRIKQSGLLLSIIYYIFSNYGRNFKRLAFWILFIWLMFGTVYAGYPLPDFLSKNSTIKSFLVSLRPQIDWGTNDNRPSTWFSPYYFSISSSMTLTFGDIKPVDWKGRLYVCLEVLAGYLMLSLFVAMLISYEGRYEKIDYKTEPDA